MKDVYENEIWKDVVNYEGLYQVSNEGRVRSLTRMDNLGREWQGKIMSLKTDKKFRKQIQLCIRGLQTTHLVHRLVSTAFIPNPNNYPCVNHKDENPSNNMIDNLEWCTVLYNNTYGTRLERARKNTDYKKRDENFDYKLKAKNTNYKKVSEKNKKPIMQFDLEGNFIREWLGIVDAAKYLNTSDSGISNCLSGKRKTACGYIWRLVDETSV